MKTAEKNLIKKYIALDMEATALENRIEATSDYYEAKGLRVVLAKLEAKHTVASDRLESIEATEEAWDAVCAELAPEGYARELLDYGNWF